jgi:sucrose-6-phosphate hydrolase SacC (GH32 family)
VQETIMASNQKRVFAQRGVLAIGLLTLAAWCVPPLLAAEPGRIEEVERRIRAATELREMLQRDPQRPKYHFIAPWGWMNDPNGAIFWKGKYHLFYQCNPNAAFAQWMQWGHASSKDLVHWTHHPVALSPTPGAADRESCFSGGAVNHDGVATFIYHGVPDGTCIATSKDDDLLHWTKHPKNPVIAVPKPGQNAAYGVYDPCAWKQGDSWYALSGWGRNFARPDVAEGDVAYLFRSPDLVHWEYLHPFYRSDRKWTDADEDCAVPDFFPLGGKHVLLFASHKRGAQYYVGRYEKDRFLPEQHGRMNWPGGQLIAPITMLDDRGRRIFFAWVAEGRGDAASRAAGWAGVMTLPRVLTLAEDHTLRIEPAAEVELLRLDRQCRENISLSADAEVSLDGIQGDSLEIQAEFVPGKARQVGLVVRCSPDGAEQTRVLYDAVTKTFQIDGSRASLTPSEPPFVPVLPPAERSTRCQAAPFDLKPDEPLRVRIFLDRSLLEVFVNGRQSLTQRIYPSRPDSLGIRLFSRGGPAEVKRIEVWRMAATGG